VIGGLSVTVVLLLVNGGFVAAEFSLIAARRSRVEQLAEAGDARAEVALRALRELGFTLSAAQVGITVCSLLLGAVAEPTLSKLIEDGIRHVGLSASTSEVLGFVVALVAVVFLVMVVAEMVPKYVAIADPERVLLLLVRPIRAFARAARPLVSVLNAVRNGGLRLVGVEATDELSEGRTGDEIADLLAISRQEGILPEVEHRLMTGALRLSTRTVRSVMVDRQRIRAVSAATPGQEIGRLALEHGHSRLVVFGRDLDDVLGYVHVKDLLALDDGGLRRPVPGHFVRRMLVTGAERTLDELLLAMRRARVHVALVRDAAGGTAGIATLEDVLEALVGDIRDEHDHE
jgi:CBS domain containing-hemolysin-like protein